MTRFSDSLATRPPVVAWSTVLLSERCAALKIGKLTMILSATMPIELLP